MSRGGGCSQAGSGRGWDSISPSKDEKDRRGEHLGLAGAHGGGSGLFSPAMAVLRSRGRNLNKKEPQGESCPHPSPLPPLFPGDTRSVAVAVIQTLFP